MGTHPDPTQARALSAAQETAERLKLATRSAIFAQRSALLNGRPTPLQDRLAADFIETVNISQRQAAKGFLPAPAHIIGQGDVLAGYQKSDAAPIRLGLEEINRHITVYGASGTAKSSWVAFLLAQLTPRVKKWLFDPKDDARQIAIANNALIIDHLTRLRVFHPPSFLTLGEFISHIATTWARTHYGGSTFKGTMHQALRQMYATVKNACPADLKRIVEHLITKVFTFNMKDSLALAAYRLDRFGAIFPGIFNATDGITIDEALDENLHFSVKGLEEGAEWLLLFLLSLLLLRNRARQQRHITLDTVVVIDEGLLLWSNQNAGKIDAVPLLSQLHTMVREFGIGMIVTSTSIRLTDTLLRSNAYIQVAMNTTDASSEIGKAFGLNPAEQAYYDFDLTRGEFIIRLGDRWREPILAVFPHLATEKYVPPEIWTAAPRGNHSLAASIPEPQLDPSMVAQLPPAEATPTIIETPAADGSQVPTDVELTASQALLNNAIASDPGRPSTHYYGVCKAHVQQGHRDKIRLRSYQLIEQSYEVIKNGRGGKACILWPTEEGYRRAGIKPRLGTRGGGLWHNYAVFALARSLHDPSIEASVAGKFVDLLIHAKGNDRLIACVREQVPDAVIPTDAVIAIEVEKEFQETGDHNLREDLKAGLFVIVGVRRYDLRRAQASIDALSPEEQERAVTVDILDLIEHLTSQRPSQSSK